MPTVPAGGGVSVRVAAAGLMTTETLPVVESAGDAASVALTATIEVPAAVGVPLREQFAFSVRPAGSVPLTRAQL